MHIVFPLVAKKRKVLILTKIVLLVLILLGMSYKYLGTYVPVELWEVVIVFLITSITFNLVRFFTVTAYRRRSQLPVGERDNFVIGIDSVSNLVVFLVTLFSTFSIFDIAFQTFFASISVVAVALVLIFRDYISNYLDSFRLMFSTDYRIGDYIKVSEFTKGIITDISFRATTLKTDEGDVLFIPNTKLMTSEVVNYSKTKFKRITVPFSLPITTIVKIAAFEKTVKQTLLKAFPELVVDNKMFLRVKDVHDWQTTFSFEVSVDQYNFAIEDKITNAVYQQVLHEQKKMKTPEQVILHR